MKKSELKQLIKEEIFKVLNEEKSETEITSDAEKALKASLATLKSGLSQVKISPKNKEAASKNKEINEAIGWTIYNLVVGAPGLLSLLGKAVDGVSNFFVLDKNQDGTVIGRALNKASHKLEHAYLDTIGLGLQKAFPDLYPKTMDVHNPNFPLYDAARKVYISLLVAGGIGAGFSAASAHSLIHKAVEVGEIGIKAGEVTNLAKAIASSPA